MATEPDSQNIEELVSFLPIFTREGFDPVVEWDGGELLPSGARTFPWPVYHEAVIAFFQMAGKAPWCDYEYAGKDVPALLQEENYLERATLQEIKTVLTFCVRGERFCDGHWGAMIREGVVQRLLARLAVIEEGI